MTLEPSLTGSPIMGMREVVHSVPMLSTPLLFQLSQRRRVQMAQEATSDRQPRRNEEDASDEEEEMEDEDEEVQENSGHAATGQPPRHARLSEAEKQGLRADFIREMHERFLDGRDVGFDYM